MTIHEISPKNQAPSRYTGVWRDALDKTPQMQAVREQAWLAAVHAVTYADGEADIAWPEDWQQAWLPWSSKSPTLWNRDDMRQGKRLYRQAYQVGDETPDYQIKPENVRRFAMIVARRGLREVPEQLTFLVTETDVDQGYAKADTGYHGASNIQPPSPPPPGILSDFQQLLFRRIALARTLTSVSATQVSEVDVLLDIIRKAVPSLIDELRGMGVDVVKLAQAQGINVDECL